MAGFCGKCGAKLRDKSHFSLTYDVKGGRDFTFQYRTDWANWEGELHAAPGEVITLSYTATYPTAKQMFGFDQVAKNYDIEYIWREEVKYMNEDMSENTFSYLHYKKNESSSATTKSGSFSITVPKLEDLDNLTVGGKYSKMIIMAVNSRYNRTLKTDKDSTQTALLDYSIKIIVDEDEEGNENAGVTTKAATESGDKGEMGASVPSAIVLGVLATAGAGAAAAAVAGSAGSTGGGSDPSGDDGKKNGTFKMYVSKDFGDGIRRGAKPVKIRARMVEIIDGQERDRPDLNRNITITGQDMNIHGAVITGRYLEVGVSVDAACQADEAIITFLYNGKGGTFRNNIVFKVVGDPYYQFAVLSSKDKSEGYSEGPYPAAIFGDRFTYKMKFTIAETTGYPTEIKIKSLTPELEGKVVRDKSVEYGYILTVVNKSRALAKPKVFVDEDKRDVEIISVFEDGTRLADKAGLSLYPEGLSVTAKTKEDRLEVQSYEQEYSAERAPRFEPKEFDINFIVKGETKSEFIMPDKADVQFKKIRGQSGKGSIDEKIAEKYEYKVLPVRDRRYSFTPQIMLYQQDKEELFVILLPIECTDKGNKYELEMPIRLVGKLPDPMAGWDIEYEKLKSRVERFSLPEDKQMWLEKLDSCALDPKVSIQELRLVGKALVAKYMRYWEKQNEADRAEAAKLDWIVSGLEWTKFIGDCAFSFLVNVYAGPVAEAIISPAKDFAAEAIGELLSSSYHGEDFDMNYFNFSKNLAAMGDNLVSNNISITNWKKAAATLGCYFVYAAAKNYLLKLNEGESDFFGAFVSAFSDMSIAAIKVGAGELFKEWIKGKTFQEKIGPRISKFMNEYLGKNCKIDLSDTSMRNIQQQLNDNMGFEGELKKLVDFKGGQTVDILKKNIVEKYISDFAGWGTARIVEKETERKQASTSSDFRMEGGFIHFTFSLSVSGESFTCDLNLTKALALATSGLFGALYNMLFSNVPTAEVKIETPKDPSLPEKYRI